MPLDERMLRYGGIEDGAQDVRPVERFMAMELVDLVHFPSRRGNVIVMRCAAICLSLPFGLGGTRPGSSIAAKDDHADGMPSVWRMSLPSCKAVKWVSASATHSEWFRHA